jgi:hypothetical protein
VVTDKAPTGQRRGSRERRELMRALAGQLKAAGLNVRTLSYAGSVVDPDGLIEEVEITNHASPGRGTFRVCEDAGITWEYWGNLDREQGAKEVTATITALLIETAVPADSAPG